MPEPVTAVVVGAALVYGDVQRKKAIKEKEKAEANAQASKDKADQHFEQQMADWENTYGGVEDNLAEYYNNLSPTSFAAEGLEAYQKEYQSAIAQYQETMAQRGLSGTGMESSTLAQSELAKAAQRASIRREAPKQVAEQKRSWLELGMQKDPTNRYGDYLVGDYNLAEGKVQQAQAKVEKAEDFMADVITMGATEMFQGRSGGGAQATTSVTNKDQTGLASGGR
jgi:hypothetical protein